MNGIIGTITNYGVHIIITRTVRGSDYSPTIELSKQKDKLVTATGDTENILKNKPTKSG